MRGSSLDKPWSKVSGYHLPLLAGCTAPLQSSHESPTTNPHSRLNNQQTPDHNSSATNHQTTDQKSPVSPTTTTPTPNNSPPHQSSTHQPPITNHHHHNQIHLTRRSILSPASPQAYAPSLGPCTRGRGTRPRSRPRAFGNPPAPLGRNKKKKKKTEFTTTAKRTFKRRKRQQ